MIGRKTKEEQLQLGIKYRRKSFLENLLSSIESFKQGLEIHPYWKNGFSWLALLSSLILGLNSFLIIYFNFDRLPLQVAMLFAEHLEEDIVKDKYLLYLLPTITILIGTMVSFIAEKIYNTHPKVAKFILVLIFILSLIQLLAVYKIVNIYL